MVSPLRNGSAEVGAVPGAARAAIPRTPGVIAAEKRFESSRVAVLIALGVYGLVSLFTEWWPIGWLNLAQQQIAGSYSMKITFMGFLIIAIAVQTLLWTVLERIVTRRLAATDIAAGRMPGSAPPTPGFGAGATPPRAVPKPALSQSRLLLRMALGTLVLIWVIAAGTFVWFDRQQRTDNEAVYVPLRVGGDAAAHHAFGDHVSVQGMVLASHVVTHRSDSHSASPSYYLIPLVPEGWRPGDAAHVLLQVDHPSVLPGYDASADQRPWILPELVLGRIGTGASVIAGTAFDQIQVPLAADYQLLEVVPSQGGKPIQTHVDYLERVLWVAGVGSAAMLLMFGLSFFIVRRRERLELKRLAAAPR